jgi:lysozyme
MSGLGRTQNVGSGMSWIQSNDQRNENPGWAGEGNKMMESMRKTEMLEGTPGTRTGAPIRIPAGPITTKGLDVSHFEPNIEWGLAFDNGFRFAFAKATDGTGSKDSTFHQHRTNAKGAGLLFGGYHFLRFSGKSPEAQAEHFMSMMGEVKPGEIPPTIDVEWDRTTPQYADGKEIDGKAADIALACLEHVEKLSGMTPIIYTAASFFRPTPLPERFARFPLWIANYHVESPMVPAPWERWHFWQKTDKDEFARSITGGPDLDSNVFNGSLDQLTALVKR